MFYEGCDIHWYALFALWPIINYALIILGGKHVLDNFSILSLKKALM